MESAISAILFVHIVTMSLSLVGSFVLAGMVVGLKSVNRLHAKSTQAITGLGVIAGIILLVHNPAPASCAILIMYTVLFQVFYYKGVVPKIRAANLR